MGTLWRQDLWLTLPMVSLMNLAELRLNPAR
jgi:hypothetical protein